MSNQCVHRGLRRKICNYFATKKRTTVMVAAQNGTPWTIPSQSALMFAGSEGEMFRGFFLTLAAGFQLRSRPQGRGCLLSCSKTHSVHDHTLRWLFKDQAEAIVSEATAHLMATHDIDEEFVLCLKTPLCEHAAIVPLHRPVYDGIGEGMGSRIPS